jgi:hypothetical protein
MKLGDEFLLNRGAVVFAHEILLQVLERSGEWCVEAPPFGRCVPESCCHLFAPQRSVGVGELRFALLQECFWILMVEAAELREGWWLAGLEGLIRSISFISASTLTIWDVSAGFEPWGSSCWPCVLVPTIVLLPC